MKKILTILFLPFVLLAMFPMLILLEIWGYQIELLKDDEEKN